MRLVAVSAAAALLLCAGVASAQPAVAEPPIYPLPTWIAPPPTLPYDEGEPLPAGYILKTQLHRPLIIGGSVTFGVSYLLSVLGAAAAVGGGDGGPTPLFVPCVGPFITLGTLKTDDLGQFWLTLDGLTQSAGAAMVVAGLLVPQKYLQRNNATPTALLHPEIALGAGTTRFTWRF